VSASRSYPHVVVRRLVGNFSSRLGSRPLLIVVHDTESHNRPGVVDLESIGAWFDNPAAQASAHVCVDGEGHSARFVRDQAKAWACVGYNRVSLNIEQIGFASDPRAGWEHRGAELDETARWIARWARLWGIPIRRGAVSGGRVTRPGVVEHADLGQLGGGHHDCGPGYPLRDVLGRAHRFARAHR
jgi:hypothetical protein